MSAFPAGQDERIEPSIKIGFVNYYGERDGGDRRSPDPTHTLLNLHFVIPTLPFVIVVIRGHSSGDVTNRFRASVFSFARIKISRSLSQILSHFLAVSFCYKDFLINVISELFDHF